MISPLPPPTTLYRPLPPAFQIPPGPGAARHRGEILGAMPIARAQTGLTLAALAGLLLVAECERPVGFTGQYCGTMFIASVGEPDILLTPLSEYSITLDLTSQVPCTIPNVDN